MPKKVQYPGKTEYRDGARYSRSDIIQLRFTIRNVGRAGDFIVFDPDRPDERFRLMVVRGLEVDQFPAILEKVRAYARSLTRARAALARAGGPPGVHTGLPYVSDLEFDASGLKSAGEDVPEVGAS